MSVIQIIARHIAACLAVLFLGLVLVCVPHGALAQSETPALDSSLTDAEFQAMLGRLSDEQVRDILISEFQTRRTDTPAENRGLLAGAQEFGATLSTNARGLLAVWPQVGGAFAALASGIAAAGGLGVVLLALAVCVAAGFLVRYVWRRGGTKRQAQLAERNIGKGPYGSLATIADACLFVLIELSSVVAFAATAMAALYLFFGNADLRIFVSSCVAIATVALLVWSILSIIFPRTHPDYRLVAINDRATQAVYLVVLGLSVFWMVEVNTTDLMDQFGAPAGTPDLVSFLLSFPWVVLALLGIRMIHRRTADLLPGPEETGLVNVLTRNWARLMTLGTLGIWVLFSSGGLVYGTVDVIAGRVLRMWLLLFAGWTIMRVLVHYLRAKALDPGVENAILRTARSILFAISILMVLMIWGLDPSAVETGATAERWMQAAVAVGLTALIGWATWDFIRTLIDIRLAAEQPADDDEDAVEGEGGLGASRSATLLPLLRSFAIAIIALTCLFTALSSMGVNVAPLVAGAGVLGLAIGFGAQTLVKDIVSGVFFLIDDAFRTGEYIDLGSVKGTVERISLRSLQLRHHLGAVHTIPFGDIAALTNYSRDWVIMKLPLRLTFDTDPQQVKKIVKKIGAELMDDPLVGDGLLEPAKSQGVIQMEDSAMILRVKFKAIPGRQFTIRRELLHRIRAAFEEAGIRFASREVTVRVSEEDSHAERLEAAGSAAVRILDGEKPQGT